MRQTTVAAHTPPRFVNMGDGVFPDHNFRAPLHASGIVTRTAVGTAAFDGMALISGRSRIAVSRSDMGRQAENIHPAIAARARRRLLNRLGKQRAKLAAERLRRAQGISAAANFILWRGPFRPTIVPEEPNVSSDELQSEDDVDVWERLFA